MMKDDRVRLKAITNFLRDTVHPISSWYPCISFSDTCLYSKKRVTLVQCFDAKVVTDHMNSFL